MQISRDVTFWLCTIPTLGCLVSWLAYHFFFADRMQQWQDEAEEIDRNAQQAIEEWQKDLRNRP